MKNPSNGSTAVAERARRGQPSASDVVFSQREARQLLSALTALSKGDSSVRLPVEWTGMQGKVAETFNDVVELNERMAEELARLRQRVGKEGKLKQRAAAGRRARLLARLRSARVNALIDDLVHPTSETARVIGAVAQGDLSQTMALEVDGRPLRGRIPAHRQDGQHDGGPARLVRLGSDARGARGRHRRQAGRPGRRQGRRRHLEGPDRLA